jgi:hypothetical protein
MKKFAFGVLVSLLATCGVAYAQFDAGGMGGGLGGGMDDQAQQQMMQQQQQQLQDQMQKQAEFSDCMARAQSDQDRSVGHAQYGM